MDVRTDRRVALNAFAEGFHSSSTLEFYSYNERRVINGRVRSRHYSEATSADNFGNKLASLERFAHKTWSNPEACASIRRSGVSRKPHQDAVVHCGMPHNG